MSESILRNQLQALEAKIVRLEATLANERRPSARPELLVLVRVEEKHIKGGVYGGFLLKLPERPVDDEAVGGVLLADIGVRGDECIIINANEVGNAGHWLLPTRPPLNANERIFRGMIVGRHENGRAIVVINGFWSGECVSPPPPPP